MSKEKKVSAEATKEEKIKAMAKSQSGSGSTLRVKIGEKQTEIIHGEILSLTKEELDRLRLASAFWKYEEMKEEKSK